MSATATLNENGRKNAFGEYSKVVNRFNWKPIEQQGKFAMIDKFLLSVDDEYQRKPHAARVRDIARNWDWRGCLVLGVAHRPDGSYWVFDGQHRLLAARKREDINLLPCLVFEMASLEQEAQGFVIPNTIRGPMKSLERFHARLKANDATALEVAAMIEDIGYTVAPGGNKFSLSCVQAIEEALLSDKDSARLVLLLCADIYSGESFNNRVLKGLMWIQKLLRKQDESLTRADIRRKLIAAGPEAIEREINNALVYHGRGGERIYADGIVRLINKGKRSQQIPSPVK